MNTTFARTALALLALAASLPTLPASLGAQIDVRHGHGRNGTSTGGVGGILTGSARADARADHIPPGQLPPRGMCRVWIEGVPPGKQPAATDCATAETQRARYPGARVIYGDATAFPGRGKGKQTKRESTSTTAASRACASGRVIFGTTVPACDQSSARRDGRRDGDDESDAEVDDRNDSDRFDHGRGDLLSASAKAHVKHSGRKRGRGRG